MAEGTGPHKNGRPTDKTLAEQLQITDREIEYRKQLLDITDHDVALLQSLKNDIIDNADKIVGTFYEIQLQNSEISLLIGDAEALERLSMSMRRYILELFEGYYDSEYVNKRLRIGKVHKRIGVSPKLYVSAVNLLMTVLNDFIRDTMMERPNNDIKTDEVWRALRKLLMFDMQLVFDTYIASLVAEVDTARADLETYSASLEATVAQRTRELKEQSVRDSLTGLLNQRAFHEHLHRELSVAERTQRPLSLVYIDLNQFKKLNDTKGHREGDRLLQALGDVITDNLREVDLGCRYGGDEFCIIMPSATKAQAQEVCQRMIAAYDKVLDSFVRFSIGIADTGPNDFIDSDALIKQADKLMYKAKAKAHKSPGHYIEM